MGQIGHITASTRMNNNTQTTKKKKRKSIQPLVENSGGTNHPLLSVIMAQTIMNAINANYNNVVIVS